MDATGHAALDDIRAAFRQQRDLAERAAAQLTDAELFRTAGAEDNSVAVLMKHVGGNLRSRWTDSLTTDGEKPDRNRDGEFITDDDDAAAIRAVWERGWTTVDAALEAFTPADLAREVRIRGESLTAHRALLRSLTHTAQHVGQIILLAKQWKGEAWETLSIPRAARPG